MANDQAKVAEEYKPIVVAWRNGAAVRLGDLGDVVDGVTDLRNYGMANGKPAVLLIIFRQPNANIIEVVDAITALMPELQSTLPASVDIKVMIERTSTIRAALRDVERTLLISVALVILVVYLFLRNGRATLIPAVAIPISLVGTFAAMYMLGFSLNNLSLMALIVATGFVVDDAIVVLENVSRHIEAGMKPFEAALTGAREVAFTVVSMSISLVAVFIPILFMGGIVGRLFREFAVTLSVAIGISLIVSLSTTPMMCSRLLQDAAHQSQSWLSRWSERALQRHAPRLRAKPRLDAQGALAHGAGVRRHGPAQHLHVRGDSRRASSRSRTPGASSASCAPTSPSRSRRCARSSTASPPSSWPIRPWTT